MDVLSTFTLLVCLAVCMHVYKAGSCIHVYIYVHVLVVACFTGLTCASVHALSVSKLW